ncbi:MAG: phosphoglycerate kinase [Gammaproteobacteria bacterium]
MFFGDICWRGKTALLRADFNVPLRDGKVADTSRIAAALPTIKAITESGGGVVCLSHLGRPSCAQAGLSLQPVAEKLALLINKPVRLITGFDEPKISGGEVALMENTRFNKGEQTNDRHLALRYAAFGDMFVLDAFSAAHRREASLCALAEVCAPNVCAGLLLNAELQAAKTALKNPRRPVVVIAGGAKISDKLGALNNLLPLCDMLLVGGGAANTFLAAGGANTGNSLIDKTMLDAAKTLLHQFGDKIVMMEDAITDDGNGNMEECALNNIGGRAIVDIGINTARKYADIIQNAGTVIWSGPMGKYENPQTNHGTKAIATAAAKSNAYTLAGGGDTISAINLANVAGKINHLSTGGSAFLQMLAGGEMPALDALNKASEKKGEG